MPESSQHKGQREDKISGLLKKLPRVTASPDFESRLQRRIISDADKRFELSFVQKIISSLRIPVYLYALMTVVLVISVWYLAIRQPSIPPLESVEQHDTQRPSQFKSQNSPTLSEQPQHGQQLASKKERENSRSSIPVQETLKRNEQDNQAAGASSQSAVTSESQTTTEGTLDRSSDTIILQQGNSSDDKSILLEKSLPTANERAKLKTFSRQSVPNAVTFSTTINEKKDSAALVDSVKQDSLKHVKKKPYRPAERPLKKLRP